MSEGSPAQLAAGRSETTLAAVQPMLLVAVAMGSGHAAVDCTRVLGQFQHRWNPRTLAEGTELGLKYWVGCLNSLEFEPAAALPVLTEIAGKASRVALHRGLLSSAITGRDDPVVDRACRILFAAPQSTVLLSAAAEAAVRPDLPPEMSLRPLGAHRLTDLLARETLFALAPEQFDESLPELRTLEGRKHNLPPQTVLCLGRGRDVRAILAAFAKEDVRLLTLVGPGGTGKTRLSLEVAARMVEELRDGAWFVDLVPLRDPDRLVDSIATVLDIHESGGTQLVQTIAQELGDRRLLLVLDNFEHVTSAAPTVEKLLSACPGLRILVTSREPLRIAGEHVVPIDPLTLPQRGSISAAQLLRSPAAVLFWQRARQARPELVLTDDLVPLVASICNRLDGLPLALELAAARCQTFTLAELAEALRNRLQTLRGGARSRTARQQTLQGLIDWSYTLLTPGEQALFARLSVFSGGFTASAAEAVCSIDDDLPFAVEDGIESLVSRSLVRKREAVDGPDGQETRFVILETIHEYAHHALERLSGREVSGTVRDQHVTYFLKLAEEAAPQLMGPQQLLWLARLDTEHDNMREALGSTLSDAPVASAMASTATLRPIRGLALAGALWRFWYVRSHLTEGRAWLSKAIERARDAGVGGENLATALNGAGVLAVSQGDNAVAKMYCERSLAICRQLGDLKGAAVAVSILGNVALVDGDYERAVNLMDESLSLNREIGDTRGITVAINNLGYAVLQHGGIVQAENLFAESLSLNRELGDRKGIAAALNNLATTALVLNKFERAQSAAEECLACARELGDIWICAEAMYMLGQIQFEVGNIPRAETWYQESYDLAISLGDQFRLALIQLQRAHIRRNLGDFNQAKSLYMECVEALATQGHLDEISSGLVGLAELEVNWQEFTLAAWLIGASAICSVDRLAPSIRLTHDQVSARAKLALGDSAFEAASQSGYRSTREQVLKELPSKFIRS